MQICLGKDISGYGKYIVYDGKTITQSKKVPKDCWVFSNNKNINDRVNLKLLLEHNGIFSDLKLEDKWKKVADIVKCEDVPWKLFMPQDQWKKWVSDLLDSLWKSFVECDAQCYENIFIPSQRILRLLKRACINKEQIKKYLDNDEDLNGSLKSFIPQEDGFSNEIKYAQNTISGRLTVKSGPNILILKKNYRNIIKSKYKNGKIMSIDYVSAEPRIALILAGRKVPHDIYQDISDNLFNGKVDRKVAKQLVLSIQYGAGKKLLLKSTNLDVADLASMMLATKKYFKINEIQNRLLKEYKEFGFIKNYYGKIIRIKDPAPHKLYNAYIQSTVVFASLLGFSNIKFEDMEEIDPVFVIHDDLMIDVGPRGEKYIPEILESTKKIVGFDERFDIKCDIVE